MSKNNIIMAIYPNSRGLGFVLCGDTPNDIISRGVGSLSILSPYGYVSRLRKMITRYRPSIVVLKDYYDAGVVVSPRVRKIIEAMEKEAYSNELTVYRYSRKHIRKIFEPYTDNTNKYGISLVLSLWYPDLKRFLAPPRTITTPESYRTVVFDAYSLLYCYFTLSHLNQKQKNENTNN